MALTTPTNDLTGNTIASTYDQLLFIDGTAITNSTLYTVAAQAGETALRVANDQILIKDSSGTDIASCFEVQDKDGTICLSVDGTNNRVGIGTNAPSHPLSVEKDTGGTYDATTVAAIFGDIDSMDNVYITGNTINMGYNSAGDGSALYLNYRGHAGAVSYYRDLVIADGKGTTIVHVDGSNHAVGIGVADPDVALEILKASTQFKLSYDGSNYASFDVAADGLLTITTADDAEADIILSPAGNVGIGTVTPGSLLDVRGAAGTGAASAGVLTLSTAEATVRVGTVDQLGRIDFQAPVEDGGTDAILVGASIGAVCQEDFSSSNNSTALFFSTGTTSAPIERMRVNQDGFLGIGTSAPTSLLHIDQLLTDTTIIELASTNDVAHGMTEVAPTGDYAVISKSQATSGGLAIKGLKDAADDAGYALYLIGYLGEAADTTKSTSSIGVVQLSSYITDGSTGTAVVGSNGNLAVIDNGGSAKFVFDAEGTMHHAGGLSSSGMDYSEMFQWIDRNSSNEDRAGFSVVLVDGNIRPAIDGEQPFGVVSYLSGIKGNVGLEWRKIGSGNEYKQDEYGRYIEDSNGDRIANPDYNSNLEYISRLERKEWQAIGLLGQVPVRHGQPVNDKWVKMYEISDNASMYYIFPSEQVVNNNN